MLRRFLGPITIRWLAIGAASGLALGFIELAIAGLIQALLVAIGLTVELPDWLPARPTVENVSLALVAIGTQ